LFRAYHERETINQNSLAQTGCGKYDHSDRSPFATLRWYSIKDTAFRARSVREERSSRTLRALKIGTGTDPILNNLLRPVMTTATAAPTLLERFQTEFATSHKLHEQARRLFPNGVTHDLRHLEPFPVYVSRAQGPFKWDVDGHRLIDYFTGHGALLLGHSHPVVVTAVQRQMERATHPGACHELEIEWGQWVQKLIPSAERLRFVGSGTEATLMAQRLARIHTGRPKVLKFLGHFHGWNDYLLPGAYPPYDDLNVVGVPEEVRSCTVVLPPNDPAAVERAFAEDVAIGCVILEPTGGHMGSVPIRGDFLRALRDITRRHNRLLIFDEVVTGFRVHPGGAQAHYGILPDMTTLAKVLAGGLPGGCVAGRADVFASLEFRPGKPKLRHPGTFNANPLSAAAGVAALSLVATGEPCRKANEMARLLRHRLNVLFELRNLDWVAFGEFSCVKLLTGYQGPRPTGDDFLPYGGAFAQLEQSSSPQLVHAFRLAMLLHGIDLPGFAAILSAAHTEAEIEQTVQAVDGAASLLQQEGLV
jgi:glutamate-1-semialdehyde 2,1-aminomutase